MRKNSAIQRRKDKRKEGLELDITSLLDILVILLVFLLKSFNASELTLDLVKNLDVPTSSSDKLGQRAPIIQINKNKKVWMDYKEIGTINSDAETVQFLYQKLKLRKTEDDKAYQEKYRAVAQKDKKKKKEIVNIVLDQKLPYTVLKQVMNTSARAGYKGFKFIVKGNY